MKIGEVAVVFSLEIFLGDTIANSYQLNSFVMEHLGRRCSSRNPSRHCRHDVDQQERAHRGNDERDHWHGRFWNGIDISSEQRPQLTSEQNSEWQTNHHSDGTIHRCLPSDGGYELVTNETKRAQ